MLRAGTLINGYEVLSPIGAGGFGAVYRARQPGTSIEVALKVPHRASPLAARRFLEEARALARARHPGVVRVLDYGLAHELPYCAMELVSGESLAEWLGPYVAAQGAERETTLSADAEPRRDGSAAHAPAARERVGLDEARLDQALGWIAELCETLAFLHDEGIVHGDIKPSNLIVSVAGPPRLVDFGIASFRAGGSGREVPGLFAAGAGTRAYSAPERLRGGAWDGRADLYSIGCILHELVLGRPPSAPGVCDAGLAGRARAVGLELAAVELIAALLSTDARNRPRSADEVMRRLGSAARSGVQSVARRFRLPRSILVGRSEVLRSLAERVGSQVDGPGGMLVISGASGVGKTRLLSELLAQSAALVVISDATCDVPSGPTWQRWGPLSRLRPVLHALLAEWSSLSTDEQQALRGPGLAWISGHEPALAPLLGRGAGTLPTLRPQEVRELVFAWLERALEALARRRGLLLVIDDLQWSDELSLELLSRLARRRPLPRVAVLAAVRIGEPDARVEALLQATGVHHEPLGQLTPPQIVELCQHLLERAHLPERLTRQAVERACGNPFLLIQLLEEAARRGVLEALRTDPAPDAGQPNLPALELCHSLEELLATRVADLSVEARQALQLSAVLGTRFAQRSLRQAAADPGGIDAALLELRRARLLDDTAGGHVCFVHDSFRDAIYASLPQELRTALHDRAFATLRAAARGARAKLEDLLALAHHAEQAGRVRLAARLQRRAAVRLTRLGALEQARSLLSSALASAGSADVLERLGSVLARLGRYEQAAEQLELARARQRRPVARIRLSRQLGRVYTAQHQHVNAERELCAALDAAATCGGSLRGQREWLAASIDLFWVHYFRDERPAMSALLSEMEAASSRAATRRQRAARHELCALLGLREQRYVVDAGVVAHARAACNLLQPSRDPLERARARFQLGLIRLFSDEHAFARHDLGEALEQARAHGDTLLEARSLTYLTVALRRADEIEAVSDLAAQALTLTERFRLSEYVATACANLAWVALRRGDANGAAQYATRALTGWASSPVVYPLRWLAALPLLDVVLTRADGQAAGQLAHELLAERQMCLPEPLAALLHRICELPEVSPSGCPALLDELRRHAAPIDRLVAHQSQRVLSGSA